MSKLPPAATGVTRIAMWSGPRNISTAMMRSWGNRPDTFPHDEPFYGHYLHHTGLNHPGAEEVMAHHETNWRNVVEQLLGPVPPGTAIYYQKHMAHHLLPHFDRAWLPHLRHGFLIRNPRHMLLSLSQKLQEIQLEDTGLPQQVEIFNYLRQHTDQKPPVVDAEDVQNHPERALAAVCDGFGVPFRREMLTWPAGARETDGVWAKYWYAAVEASTQFHPYRYPNRELPDHLEALYNQCLPYYETLAAHRLKL